MGLDHELIALEERRADAIGVGDLVALADVLDDDYLHVLAPGTVVDKAGYIEMIRNGPRRPVRSNLRVRTYGDAAVLTGDLENRIGPDDDVQRVIAAFCTQVAIRTDGTWRFVSYILTRTHEEGAPR
jgi:undecaprenyl pyrophosphate synthase